MVERVSSISHSVCYVILRIGTCPDHCAFSMGQKIDSIKKLLFLQLLNWQKNVDCVCRLKGSVIQLKLLTSRRQGTAQEHPPRLALAMCNSIVVGLGRDVCAGSNNCVHYWIIPISTCEGESAEDSGLFRMS